MEAGGRRLRTYSLPESTLDSITANKRLSRSDLNAYLLVEAGGFGPPKRNATDLQSAPFGHSGTLPYIHIA